jgi:hypothetical protein
MGRPRKFTDTEKWCSRCESWKTFDHFTKNKGYRGGGYSSLCKDCSKKYREEHPRKSTNKDCERATVWNAKNKKRRRMQKCNQKDYLRSTRYGLTPEDYKKMYEDQNGKCALPSCSGDAEFVDHDHETSKVRRLLCRLCNSGLGFFRDNPNRLLEAVEYLKSFGR